LYGGALFTGDSKKKTENERNAKTKSESAEKQNIKCKIRTKRNLRAKNKEIIVFPPKQKSLIAVISYTSRMPGGRSTISN